MPSNLRTLPTPTRKAASSRIRSKRNEAGVTREALVEAARARGLVVSDRTIGAIERAEVSMIAAELEVVLDELLEAKRGGRRAA